MALTTYTSINDNGDPIILNVVDSGTATVPVTRPTTFTPLAGYPTLTAAMDYGVGTTPAKRPQVFEGPSFSCALDPGLLVSG